MRFKAYYGFDVARYVLSAGSLCSFFFVISPQPFFQVCLWRTGSLRLSFYGDILEYRYTRIVNEINEQPMQREVAAVYIYHKT